MTFGTKVGRAIGRTAAYAVEGTVRGAVGLGQFGADVVAGTEQGYAEQAAANLINRRASEERRAAKLAALKTAKAMAALGEPVQLATPMVAAAT